MSENREHLLIEVYKEHTAQARHEDNILYRFGRFMVPFSFILLGVPYVKDIEDQNLIILEIVSTIGGLILMTFWVCYVYATHAKILARFQIINQIERDWRLNGHKDIPDIRDEIFGKPCFFHLRTHSLEKSIFYVYWLLVVILTAWRFWGKWTNCVSLSELLVVAIIIGSIAIALRYNWRVKRGDKHRGERNSQHI